MYSVIHTANVGFNVFIHIITSKLLNVNIAKLISRISSVMTDISVVALTFSLKFKHEKSYSAWEARQSKLMFRTLITYFHGQ